MSQLQPVIRLLQNTEIRISKDVLESRTIEFVISDETKDRHGSVIRLKGWNLKNFKKNGIVGYQHELYGSWGGDSNPDSVIAKATAFIEGDKLIGRATFEAYEDYDGLKDKTLITGNQLAEKIFRKVVAGTLKSTSVGFMPIIEGNYGKDDQARGGKDQTFFYDQAELLEFSIVNIPSNPNAVKRALDIRKDMDRLERIATELKQPIGTLIDFIEKEFEIKDNPVELTDEIRKKHLEIDDRIKTMESTL